MRAGALLGRFKARLRPGAASGPKKLRPPTSAGLPDFSGLDVPVFFITGRGRSGTTWLRTILNAHPEIMCWGEGRFFERGFKRKDFERWEMKDVPPISLYGAISESEHLRAWIESSPWTRDRDAEKLLAGLTRLAAAYFLSGRLSESGKKIVGDKTPFVKAEVMQEIAGIYPEAKVIHIVRDGRDTAVSLIHHMWNYPKAEGGIYRLKSEELRKRDSYRNGSLVPPAESLFTSERLRKISTDWSTEVGKAIEDGRALLGGNYTEVRYEDLLQSLEKEVSHLLGFLGVDVSEEVVRKCVHKSGFERGAGRERGREDSSSRFRKGIAGDWRNVFTAEDRRIFKESAGDLLVKLGYEKDDDW